MATEFDAHKYSPERKIWEIRSQLRRLDEVQERILETIEVQRRAMDTLNERFDKRIRDLENREAADRAVENYKRQQSTPFSLSSKHFWAIIGGLLTGAGMVVLYLIEHIKKLFP